jgi:hypothetical protein
MTFIANSANCGLCFEGLSVLSAMHIVALELTLEIGFGIGAISEIKAQLLRLLLHGNHSEYRNDG